MTPKQEERIREKIKRIKAALAADKKRWGGYYDDSPGLRYLPPALYLQLEDYSGALRYFNWFHKNFPTDCGFPDFLFEWTVVLFKTKRLKQAESKAFETFCRNTYFSMPFWASQSSLFKSGKAPISKIQGFFSPSPIRTSSPTCKILRNGWRSLPTRPNS